MKTNRPPGCTCTSDLPGFGHEPQCAWSLVLAERAAVSRLRSEVERLERWKAAAQKHLADADEALAGTTPAAPPRGAGPATDVHVAVSPEAIDEVLAAAARTTVESDDQARARREACEHIRRLAALLAANCPRPGILEACDRALAFAEEAECNDNPAPRGTRVAEWLADTERSELPEGTEVWLCSPDTTMNVRDWGLWSWRLPERFGGNWDGYASTERDAIETAFHVADALAIDNPAPRETGETQYGPPSSYAWVAWCWACNARRRVAARERRTAHCDTCGAQMTGSVVRDYPPGHMCHATDEELRGKGRHQAPSPEAPSEARARREWWALERLSHPLYLDAPGFDIVEKDPEWLNLVVDAMEAEARHLTATHPTPPEPELPETPPLCHWEDVPRFRLVGPGSAQVWSSDGVRFEARYATANMLLAFLHRAGLLPSGLTPEQRRDLGAMEAMRDGRIIRMTLLSDGVWLCEPASAGIGEGPERDDPAEAILTALRKETETDGD